MRGGCYCHAWLSVVETWTLTRGMTAGRQRNGDEEETGCLHLVARLLEKDGCAERPCHHSHERGSKCRVPLPARRACGSGGPAADLGTWRHPSSGDLRAVTTRIRPAHLAELAMDIAEVLALAVEAAGAAAGGGHIQQPGARHRLTRGGRTFVERARKMAKRKRAMQATARLTTQVQRYNSGGTARTADHLMIPPGHSCPRTAGRGQWKRWTVPAVCKAAFTHAATTCRGTQAVVGSGSHSHAAQCKYVMSRIILEGQRSGWTRLLRSVHPRPAAALAAVRRRG